eukprot:CAMPEP_0119475262 /NCGR_PEP_ID=MMETSP1344-20130328/6214_1 /TAXON_ID=236787 /ORGANISM="Florenciella parvula, Strain CCMP2471" /LENGTH=48 /DNA_ID= /DNA_START= /DNA_END= /DNA_ORIENTATION=
MTTDHHHLLYVVHGPPASAFMLLGAVLNYLRDDGSFIVPVESHEKERL